ncbi:MAG: 6,7-dimethyl-8-ribityllumazine synthase [Bacteroidota bacterium]|jgi:6,7-dimethyl-8-ribityllumazine synthase
MVELKAGLDGVGLKIGIVRCRFNEPIGRVALEACLGRLGELGVAGSDIVVIAVAGALEAPLALQRLAGTGRFDALVALGAVIRGETYHFEVVANESASGLMQVQLDTGVPIANGILTTDTEAQAEARAAPKGRDCAEVAVEMARLARAIDNRHG